MAAFDLAAEFMANGNIPIKKYVSTRDGSGLNAYFVDMDCQVINGYFCFGIDHPEANGIESLMLHFDSSMGTVPKALRGETLKPAWQFHGAENSLSDRDQSCYICTALGEKSFEDVFVSGILTLQNMEHVFSAHSLKAGQDKATDGAENPPNADIGRGDESESEPDLKITPDEVYCLSESGEGAMAWEGTIQLMFPGVKSFGNRLLSSGDAALLSQKTVDCFFNFYRPDNLSVIIAGKIEDKAKILEMLGGYEEDYYATHDATPFIRPWTYDIPNNVYAKENATSIARFFPRNPNREPTATVCVGWRGCNSLDIETALGIKVLTAHLAVGPLWTQFVVSGDVQRISWCQLEYVDCCSLITMHGITSDEICEKICRETDDILDDLGDVQKNLLNLDEVRQMADRVGWHYVRELEADPYLILASAISKAERYGMGQKEQLEKRLNPLQVFMALKNKPLDYWQGLIRTYFIGGGTFATRVLPGAYDKMELPTAPEVAPVEAAEPQQFTSSSRRASSRPRRRASAVGEESNAAVTGTDNAPTTDVPSPRPTVKEVKAGYLESMMTQNAFPFGDRTEELNDFTSRLQDYVRSISEVAEEKNRFFPITSYRSDGTKQHQSFPVDDMPFFTFVEDVQTSFVYATVVVDTTNLDAEMRKCIAPITAALGAIICPRPPGLDTDNEILEPNEFNPPRRIVDSQASLGVNGEMMQHIFMMLIVLPENYEWAVGMFQNLLYKPDFSLNFLKFISSEAIKGLAANYRMQTAEVPNYDCFDSAEINLHSLVEMIYKPDSNARLFVGRRRLDAMNEFMVDLERDPEGTRALLIATWKKIVDEQSFVVQLGMDVQKVSDGGKVDLVAPWKKYFQGIGKPWKIPNGKLRLESELMMTPKDTGTAVTVKHSRPPCLTTAIPISPSGKDFPALCIAAQLFSMAQKWIFACFGEEDSGMPVLRMPCSYSHLLTLNLESSDVVGFMKIMKQIMTEDWNWLEPLIVTTKQMVINDPAIMDNGPQGTIMMAGLAHMSGISVAERRGLLAECLKVTKEDLQHVIRTYLVKLFDPKQCWYALMSESSDQPRLIECLRDFGFTFTQKDLHELCTEL